MIGEDAVREGGRGGEEAQVTEGTENHAIEDLIAVHTQHQSLIERDLRGGIVSTRLKILLPHPSLIVLSPEGVMVSVVEPWMEEAIRSWRYLLDDEIGDLVQIWGKLRGDVCLFKEKKWFPLPAVSEPTLDENKFIHHWVEILDMKEGSKLAVIRKSIDNIDREIGESDLAKIEDVN
jgi:hypothetical protein